MNISYRGEVSVIRDGAVIKNTHNSGKLVLYERLLSLIVPNHSSNRKSLQPTHLNVSVEGIQLLKRNIELTCIDSEVSETECTAIYEATYSMSDISVNASQSTGNCQVELLSATTESDIETLCVATVEGLLEEMRALTSEGTIHIVWKMKFSNGASEV